MEPHGPESYSLLQYAGVVGLSVWGGIVNFWQNIKSGNKSFSVMELVGEMSTSAFAGIVTFYLCEAVDLDDLFTAATVGIAGHMGGRTIALVERLMGDRADAALRRFLGHPPSDKDKDKGPEA